MNAAELDAAITGDGATPELDLDLTRLTPWKWKGGCSTLWHGGTIFII